MTSNITIQELLKVFALLEPDPEGYVRMKDYLDFASQRMDCTPLTVRNFILKNIDKFETKHGWIKLKAELQTVPVQIVQSDDYKSWLERRNVVLDECAEFLKIQTPSPYIENLLVKLASIRDELKSYSDGQLASFLLDLKREFNFSPRMVIE